MLTMQILRLSYPWIGIPMEMLRARNMSTMPFLVAHITRVILYYVMYQACQIAAAIWLYGEDFPGQKELWLYAILMMYVTVLLVCSILS